MFMIASVQSVADDLVDFDQRAQIVRRVGADPIDLFVDPDAD
jgi:hypothetical protein